MLILAISLVMAADYMDKHEQLRMEAAASVQMSHSFHALEDSLMAQLEAEELSAAIAKRDTVAVFDYPEAERTEQLAAAIAGNDVMGVLEYSPSDIQDSGDAYLDSLVEEFIQKAVTEDMSRAESLQACYDYMVANYTYGYNYNYSYGSGKKSTAWATAFLRDGYGACNNWSSAFVYIAKALGYDCKLCYGGTASSRGGSVEHYWPVIVVEGNEYVFDPQVEGDMTRRSGVNQHKRFGLSGQAAAAKYYFNCITE